MIVPADATCTLNGTTVDGGRHSEQNSGPLLADDNAINRNLEAAAEPPADEGFTDVAPATARKTPSPAPR